MNRIDLLRKINESSSVYIYGAGDVAKEVGFCLSNKPYNVEIKAFLVSTLDMIKENIFLDRPVISYTDVAKEKQALVIVAVLEKYKDEIINNLQSIGVENYCCMTFESDLWCEIRAYYYEHKAITDNNQEFLRIENIRKSNIQMDTSNVFQVYVAKSHVDKKLLEENKNRTWEKDIQVGAALTAERICETLDNVGNNISNKNKQYCELTALYWIWKNTNEKYVGLCHYRRRFDVSEDDIKSLIVSEVDAVFTIPVLNIPNVKFMYDKNHIIDDWEVMKRGIEVLCPEYMDALETVENSVCYIPYNMFIMRRDFLNTYCEWLFPILEYCEKQCKIKADVYQNRYIGFLAERLMSVYVEHNREKYNIVFADKHFIETTN